jgi:hypothetical protein
VIRVGQIADLEGDAIMASRMSLLDPFQLATPLHVLPVLPQLPFVVENTRPTKDQIRQRDLERIHDMAVKMIQESQAPERLHHRGKISSSQEYRETLAAIKNISPGQAIQVDIESAEYKNMKKGDTAFAYAIRRYLASNGIAATAYVSGPMQVIIRRDVTGSAPKKRKK